MISGARSSDPHVRRILAQIPRIGACDPGDLPLSWVQDGWSRQITVGGPNAGLVELIDNNPLVCADALAVPDAGQTLALIALAPALEAGLVVEAPALVFSFEVNEGAIAAALRPYGGSDVAIHVEPVDLGSALALTAMLEIATPDDPTEVIAAYEERFGRSFYVRAARGGEWDADLVVDRPFALYRPTLALDQPNSLLTVRVIADRHGKAGAAQVVHAMNVMCGFEESLGL